MLGSACGDESEPVSFDFAAVVNGANFVCGDTYTGLGASGSDLTPRDFRMYVHDVRLVTADGREVAVALDDDGRFQNGEVVLLDFENGCGDMGNADLNTTISGRAPAGDYTGLRFRIGVPDELNHADPTLADPPLNLTAMWWNWNGGYKHIRLDAVSSAFDGWRLHLGSTGCEGDMMGTATCTTANRPDIQLSGADPRNATVQLDLAALVTGSTLMNTDETPPGCMSAPMDMDCAPLFRELGLAFGGASATEQNVFSLVP